MIAYTLVGPLGDSFPLDGSTGIDHLGIAGQLMPPYDTTTQDVPSDTGSRVVEVRPKARTLPVPLLVQDHHLSAETLDDRVSALLSALNPADGPCTLLADALDDTGKVRRDNAGNARRRRLVCWYTGGAEAATRAWGDEYQGYFQQLGLTFLADDPYWRPMQPQVTPFRSDPPVRWLPLLPLAVGTGAVLGGSVEVNDGDALAYPVVRIEQPGTSITALNRTTGLSWTVDTSSARGSAVTVDTRPAWAGGGRAVVTDAGDNLYDKLTGTLWPLAKRSNDLQLTVAGATPGGTVVTFTYDTRHLGPV